MKLDVVRRFLVTGLLALGLSGCGDEVVVEGEGGGAKCGSATCADDQYCCDAACGLCIAQGVACIDACPE